MTSATGFLVIGGDSLVGGGLMRALQRRGHRALSTTRRRDTLGPDRVHLDFESEEQFPVPEGIGCAIVVAAATNLELCERDPRAHRINVELIPRTVASLLKHELFVTFISSNSVFGGERPWPGEDDPHAPGMTYAQQKTAGERAMLEEAKLLGAQDRLAIVRLTKILDSKTPPLPAWLKAWKAGKPVEPFGDLIFAPISVGFAGEALAILGEKRIPGALHLSGAENVTYVDLARVLSGRLGVDPALIVPTSATAKGVGLAFKPRYSGLGMARTTALSGIGPQRLEDVVQDILIEVHQEES